MSLEPAEALGQSVSIIIPAFNEEAYLGPTLDAINTAIAFEETPEVPAAEVIVVDNDSTDSTAAVARSKGASVVKEPRGNVAIARNAGAKIATGRWLIFVDADTHWPPSMLSHIRKAMNDGTCLGGAVDAKHVPKSWGVRLYLSGWRLVGRLFGMAQGATQFCTADAFAALGGYNEAVYMGEDVDFYVRLRKLARSQSCRVAFIEEEKVIPSCRKFDQWPIWKTLLLTNPLTCLIFSRCRLPWADWYSKPIR